jgi:serine/threonine-protein kinase RsbT
MTTETAPMAQILSESDVIAIRRTVRAAASEMGFGVTDTARIVTAASELARNAWLYAGSGSLQWRSLDFAGRPGIELTCEDHGPGIADVELAMQRGFSTSGGLGLGLPGVERLMDEMEIQSQLESGVRITVRKWLRS